MGFLDAAEQVLKQEGQPLHYDEITRRATAPDSHSPPSASLSCFPVRPPCAILSKTQHKKKGRAVPHAFCGIVDARDQNAFPVMGHDGSGGAPPRHATLPIQVQAAACSPTGDAGGGGHLLARPSGLIGNTCFSAPHENLVVACPSTEVHSLPSH